MSSLVIMAIDIVILVFSLVIGIPLPFCFAGAFAFVVATCGLNVTSLMVWGAKQMASLTLIAGPIFILCGMLMTDAKIIDRILDVTDRLFKKVHGNLGYIVIVTCAFIGALSGSSFTGVAAVGPALTPRMDKMGYPRGFSAALMTASTILGVLIPPSIAMIMYGWVTGVSVLACFLSTVIPAIILMAFLGVINYFEAKKYCSAGLEVRPEDQGKTAAGGMSSKRKTAGAIPALILPVLILGGIYGGFFTPTEAASVATLFTLIIGFFIYRTLSGKIVAKSLRSATGSIGAIMTMTFFCLLLSQSYVMLDLPRMLVRFFTSITESKVVILLLIFAFLVFIGMIINDTTAIVLCAPILLPICEAYGVSGVQLAAIMVVSLGIGGLTPPYASTLYLSMRVCDAKFEEILPPAIRMILLAYFPTSLLVLFIPQLSTWLPSILGYM